MTIWLKVPKIVEKASIIKYRKFLLNNLNLNYKIYQILTVYLDLHCITYHTAQILSSSFFFIKNFAKSSRNPMIVGILIVWTYF